MPSNPFGLKVFRGTKILTAWSSWLIAVFLVGTQQQNAFGQVLERYNFFGENTGPSTSDADFKDLSLDNSPTLTRGAGAASNGAANNSFRTDKFKNDGIATSNTDYFQFQASAAPGYTLSLSSIAARYAGTATYFPATTQFAYSLDNANFTLIGSPVAVAASNSSSNTTPFTYSLSGISALQNLIDTTTVTFRFYASGSTTTGGFGFFSADATSANDGLAISGSTTAVPEPTIVTLSGFSGAALIARRRRRSNFLSFAWLAALRAA